MADFSEIIINTTAEKIERMANMEINNEVIDDTSDDNSLPTSKLVYDFVSNSASGGSGDYVSYSKAQNLTDEQKAQARDNIGAFDASKIINAENYSGATNDSVYDKSAIQQFALTNTVTVSPNQTLTDRKKQIGRNNIDVDGGKWELLYTIEGDGKTKTWEYTQFGDGSPLKLTAVSAVVIQDVAEAENSYGFLNVYCDAKSTQFPAAIYNYFTKNSAPTTSGTQRAYGVVEQYKGQYRAYSVGMVAKGNEVMRYTPFMQANHTTADYPYIDRIKVQKQTGVFSAGNKIEVYGVRYYE